LWLPIIWAFLPETNNRSLESIDGTWQCPSIRKIGTPADRSKTVLFSTDSPFVRSGERAYYEKYGAPTDSGISHAPESVGEKSGVEKEVIERSAGVA
jgi:hypothetical protein